jgi:hypothetical protein
MPEATLKAETFGLLAIVHPTVLQPTVGMHHLNLAGNFQDF